MPPKKKRSGVSKSKERKLKRKQEQEEVAAALARVKAAYEHGDFMEHLSPFRTYSRHSLDLTISFSRVTQMPQEDLKWAFGLMRDSVKPYYVTSGWGWSDKEKWEELTHESACFLLARDVETKKLKAFVNFRFDLDEQVDVVYCYEIHLCPEVRRRGLGKFLMQILELIGHRTNMKKVVLTVFKANTISNSFFREKLKYTDDETSPLFCDPQHAEEYSYFILSKALVKKQASASQVAGGASQVKEASGSSTDAQKATHEERGRGNVRKTARMERQGDFVKMVETLEKLDSVGEGGSEGGGQAGEEGGEGRGRRDEASQEADGAHQQQ